jgi:outer membrane lipoprotein-sorting protein
MGTAVRAQKAGDAQGAGRGGVLEPVRLMEHRYRAAKTLQATFLETYTENGRTVRVESGVAYFRRPGKMRWEYAAPEKNLFLIDGKTAWFYVPADHTVTRVPAKQSTDWRTPLALLARETKVSRVCARIEPTVNEQAESGDDVLFTCILRGEKEAGGGRTSGHDASGSDASGTHASGTDASGGNNLASKRTEPQDTVLLEIGRETGELARIVIRDKGGVGMEFHFAGWKDDPVIAEALFHFEPPPGVAIVNGELSGSQADAQP